MPRSLTTERKSQPGASLGDSSGPRHHRWTVEPEAGGQRLDVYLAERFSTARNRVQGWIADGNVTLDGDRVRPAQRLSAGQSVSVVEPAAVESPLESVDEALEVLWQDEWFLVINKPAGLVVHPGAGRESDSVVQRALTIDPEISTVGSPLRPGIVHRLDAGTSGVMVLARSQQAYEALTEKFVERSIEKRYLAIVWGHPAADGKIAVPIGRHAHQRKQMTVRPDGRPSKSSWRVIEEVADTTLVAVRIETGRTHQIRVHMKHVGHPIVGDPIYGEARWKAVRGPERSVLKNFPRPALHASVLAFEHPSTGEALRFVAPPSDDLVSLWSDLGGDPDRLFDESAESSKSSAV